MNNTISWSVRQVSLSKLKSLDNNPRISKKKFRYLLEASLIKFGLVEIPVVNTDFTIIAGNQRFSELLKMYGRDHMIDVRFPSRKLTNKEIKQYALNSNKISAEWDFDKLLTNYSSEDLLSVGFNRNELAKNDNKEFFKEFDHKIPKIAQALEFREPFIILKFNDLGVFEKMLDFLELNNCTSQRVNKKVKSRVAYGEKVFDKMLDVKQRHSSVKNNND